MRPPCGGCQDRAVGCHGSCERYQAFDAERELIRNRRAQQGEVLQALIGMKKKQKTKRINEMKLR